MIAALKTDADVLVVWDNPDDPEQVLQLSGAGAGTFADRTAATFAECAESYTADAAGCVYPVLPAALSAARSHSFTVYPDTATDLSDAAIEQFEYEPDAAARIIAGFSSGGSLTDKAEFSLTAGERTSIASAVWAAGTRTLSGFGTLVADVASAVWGAAARTLTAFGFTVEATKPGGAEIASQASVDALGSPQQAGEAVTLPEEAPEGYGSTLTITPIVANTANPRYSTRNLAPIAQGSAPTDVLTIVDGTGAALDLRSHDLRLVVCSVDEEDAEDPYDDVLEGLHSYETAGAGLSVGSTDGTKNQVTIQHDAANTAEAGSFRYFLWDLTDGDHPVVLCKGRLLVEPAVQSVD